MEDAVESALAAIGSGEALITFGAGNIGMAGQEFLDRLRNRGRASKLGRTESPVCDACPQRS